MPVDISQGFFLVTFVVYRIGVRVTIKCFFSVCFSPDTFILEGFSQIIDDFIYLFYSEKFSRNFTFFTRKNWLSSGY